MNLLSHMRLGVDLGLFPKLDRSFIDELFLITQPAHLQQHSTTKLGADERDLHRADMLRERLSTVSRPLELIPDTDEGSKPSETGNS